MTLRLGCIVTINRLGNYIWANGIFEVKSNIIIKERTRIPECLMEYQVPTENIYSDCCGGFFHD